MQRGKPVLWSWLDGPTWVPFSYDDSQLIETYWLDGVTTFPFTTEYVVDFRKRQLAHRADAADRRQLKREELSCPWPATPTAAPVAVRCDLAEIELQWLHKPTLKSAVRRVLAAGPAQEQEFVVQFKKSGEKLWSLANRTVVQGTSHTQRGLEPGTTYVFAVAVKDGPYVGSLGPGLRAATLPGPSEAPAAPTGLRIEDGARLVWEPPGGHPKGYHVFWRPADAQFGGGWETAVTPEPWLALAGAIADLRDRLYVLRVAAENSEGIGACSTEIYSENELAWLLARGPRHAAVPGIPSYNLTPPEVDYALNATAAALWLDAYHPAPASAGVREYIESLRPVHRLDYSTLWSVVTSGGIRSRSNAADLRHLRLEQAMRVLLFQSSTFLAAVSVLNLSEADTVVLVQGLTHVAGQVTRFPADSVPSPAQLLGALKAAKSPRWQAMIETLSRSPLLSTGLEGSTLQERVTGFVSLHLLPLVQRLTQYLRAVHTQQPDAAESDGDQHAVATLGLNNSQRSGPICVVLSRSVLYHSDTHVTPTCDGYLRSGRTVHNRPWALGQQFLDAPGEAIDRCLQCPDTQHCGCTAGIPWDAADALQRNRLHFGVDHTTDVLAKELQCQFHVVRGREGGVGMASVPISPPDVVTWYEQQSARACFEVHLPGFVPLEHVLAIVIPNSVWCTQQWDFLDHHLPLLGKSVRDLVVVVPDADVRPMALRYCSTQAGALLQAEAPLTSFGLMAGFHFPLPAASDSESRVLVPVELARPGRASFSFICHGSGVIVRLRQRGSAAAVEIGLGVQANTKCYIARRPAAGGTEGEARHTVDAGLVPLPPTIADAAGPVSEAAHRIRVAVTVGDEGSQTVAVVWGASDASPIVTTAWGGPEGNGEVILFTTMEFEVEENTRACITSLHVETE